MYECSNCDYRGYSQSHYCSGAGSGIGYGLLGGCIGILIAGLLALWLGVYVALALGVTALGVFILDGINRIYPLPWRGDRYETDKATYWSGAFLSALLLIPPAYALGNYQYIGIPLPLVVGVLLGAWLCGVAIAEYTLGRSVFLIRWVLAAGAVALLVLTVVNVSKWNRDGDVLNRIDRRMSALQLKHDPKTRKQDANTLAIITHQEHIALMHHTTDGLVVGWDLMAIVICVYGSSLGFGAFSRR